MNESDLLLAMRLAIAALVGLAAGLEREWSGHASGSGARFAGLRTFFLLGLLGGIAGAFAAAGQGLVAAVLLSGGVALSVAGYVMAVRRADADTDGTTEAAALGIIALGALAGSGRIGLAAGAGAVVVLMLREKARLHWMVSRLDEFELRAGLQFSVLAVVVLPLLPAGPYLGDLAIRPRSLWMIVLLFSALNFGGFIARKAVGATRGLGLTGALGGVVSSTAVTLSFSRQSRGDATLAVPLARGALAACTVLVPRVLVMSAVLNPPVMMALLPLLLPVFAIGLAVTRFGWPADDAASAASARAETGSPLRLGTAIRMAAAFQLSMVAITFVQQRWGMNGIYATGAALGLTDVDALTASLTRSSMRLDPTVAARAIAIGILANTMLKLGIAVALGQAAFRRRVTMGLVTMAIGGGIALIAA